MLERHLRYLRRVLSHKWKVAKRCAARGLWWEAITHDLSKFHPVEWRGYVARDFASGDFELEFALALNHHYKHNDHHPEYWIPTPPRWARGEAWRVPLPMSHKARRAMLCDWGAMGDERAYYLANRDDIPLHPDTRAWVERELGIL